MKKFIGVSPLFEDQVLVPAILTTSDIDDQVLFQTLYPERYLPWFVYNADVNISRTLIHPESLRDMISDDKFLSTATLIYKIGRVPPTTIVNELRRFLTPFNGVISGKRSSSEYLSLKKSANMLQLLTMLWTKNHNGCLVQIYPVLRWLLDKKKAASIAVQVLCVCHAMYFNLTYRNECKIPLSSSIILNVFKDSFTGVMNYPSDVSVWSDKVCTIKQSEIKEIVCNYTQYFNVARVVVKDDTKLFEKRIAELEEELRSAREEIERLQEQNQEPVKKLRLETDSDWEDFFNDSDWDDFLKKDAKC
jgi:hypothetical protein